MHTSSGANCVFVSVRNSTILHNSEHRYFFVDQAEKWSLVRVKIAIATAIWYNKKKLFRTCGYEHGSQSHT
jgi:hypothetical protein